MASDLDVLIFIPAASCSAANQSSESWRSWTDVAIGHIISRKQRPNAEVPKPDPLYTMAVPRNSIHKSYEQNW